MTTKTNSQKHNDTMLKVIALVCAVLLWCYAEAQENPSKERQITVPVQYVNLASGYVVENANQVVQITVKGNETDIMSLRSDDFTAVVDLSNAAVGNAEYPVQVSSAAVSERFTYLPDKLAVSIDQILQKEVPVHLRTNGTVAEYYELQHTDIQPDTVVIQGKSSLIADISAVETVPIDISGITSDKELIGILQLPEGVTAQTLDTEFRADAEIAVYLYVQPIQSQQKLEAIIGVRNVQEGLDFVLDTEKVSLTLKGDAELLAQQPILDQLLFYVDCNHLAAGTYTLPIQVEALNETVHEALQEVSPQTVTVTLQAEVMILPNREPENGNEAINSDSDKTIDAE
ncbi:MAG: hypothetical protein IJE80_04545 [Peptococcaceae bacterium]|nr:hypothetical protein [Peptococcaceae bacterium]